LINEFADRAFESSTERSLRAVRNGLENVLDPVQQDETADVALVLVTIIQRVRSSLLNDSLPTALIVTAENALGRLSLASSSSSSSPASELIDSVEGLRMGVKAGGLSQLSLPFVVGNATVQLPSSLSGGAGSLIRLEVAAWAPNTYPRQLSGSSLAITTVNARNPVTNSLIPISDLPASDPIILTFQLAAPLRANQRAVCGYFSASSGSFIRDTTCVTQSVSSTAITCACTHTTDFGAIIETDNSGSTTEEEGGGGGNSQTTTIIIAVVVPVSVCIAVLCVCAVLIVLVVAGVLTKSKTVTLGTSDDEPTRHAQVRSSADAAF